MPSSMRRRREIFAPSGVRARAPLRWARLRRRTKRHRGIDAAAGIGQRFAETHEQPAPRGAAPLDGQTIEARRAIEGQRFGGFIGGLCGVARGGGQIVGAVPVNRERLRLARLRRLEAVARRRCSSVTRSGGRCAYTAARMRSW